MKLTRRKIIKGIVAAGAAPMAACVDDRHDPMTDERGAEDAGSSKRLLILGGTGFVGPYVVRSALAAGHVVTLFNRGRSSLEIFPDLELLVGDRNGELDSISDEVRAGRRWDAAIDLSGFSALAVREAATLLARAVEHYTFISSVAAYRTFEAVNDESSRLHGSLSNAYGPQKAQAEREAAIAMSGRVTNIRPTIIAGPDDSRDRLACWPVRVARGGEMLIPGPRELPVQFIDVRDVADFTIRCTERHLTGAFNAVIPSGSYTMGRLIDDCRAVTGASITETWVTPEFVRAQRIDAERELPLWDSPSGDRRAFSLIEAPAAFASGLRTRPPAETIRDTYEWWRMRDGAGQRALRAGLREAREAELLQAWHAGRG